VKALALAFVVAATGSACAEPRVHDGVYVRLGMGGGYAIGTLVAPSGHDASRGPGVATQLAVGWTPRPGVVVGLGTFPSITTSPHYDGTNAGGQHVSATGPFVDYFPDPHGGLHVTGGVLFAVGYLDGGERTSHIGFGPAVTAGVGYDEFVADHWSVGAVARVTAFDLFHVDDSLRIVAPAVLVTVTHQ